MNVEITRKDILSGYIAQFFQYGSGIVVLPVILNRLSAEEVGMNYVMLSVGALANIADFGFSGQIGRNVTYILSGASKIYRGEIEKVENTTSVDFGLLKVIIDASKYLYQRLSVLLLLILLTIGTLYMHHATEGFSNVDNSLWIWILFSVGTYFNLYFLYYNSLLLGAGLVKEQKYSIILSRMVYIFICFILIFNGFGLMSVVIANIISPFVARYYCYRKFYSGEIKEKLPTDNTERDDVLKALNDIWYTAKKSGTNTIGHYIGTQGSTFIAGIYLPLAVAAQWGLMIQLFSVIQGIAMNIGVSMYPEYCKLRLHNKKDELIKKSSFAIVSMIIILFIGGICILLGGPFALQLIKSKTTFPSFLLMGAYILTHIISANAQLFAILMTSRNVIPSPKAVIITSILQILFTIGLLQLTEIGIWALLLGPFVSGICYTQWAWVKKELEDMKISICDYYITGFKEIIHMAKANM